MSALLNEDKEGQMTAPIRLTRLYVATLLGLALLLTVAEVITQWQIDKFQDQIGLIRYTATQRHLSQQLAKEALQLADEHDSVTFIRLRNNLGNLFAALENSHLNSRRGILATPSGELLNRSIPNSDTVQQLYARVRPHFAALQRSVRQLTALNGPAQLRTQTAKANLALLAANEVPFLAKIDLVVLQYTNELRQSLGRLKQLELGLHVLTLLTLLGIAWFVYRPATRQLRQTLSQLIIAEKRTAEVNRKLRSLNKSLKKARQQLFEASQQQLQEQAHDQKTRTAYLLAGQEEERKRLSRELHDGLGQLLTAIKLQVEGLEGKLTANREPNAPINLSTLKNLINQTIQETRSISNNLMPSVLSDFGLLAALRMLAESHNRNAAPEATQIDIIIDEALISKPLLLEKDIEISLYRVAQEAITNAIRHGKARRIRLSLTEAQEKLLFTIDDDGIGFQTQRLTKEPHGQGVHNMHERIKLLNGTFTLHSTPGKGTTIKIGIPYHSPVVAHDYDQINVG